ncbi:MAG TPA: hypothetical protein DDW50_02970 [Firmicutes bacterium]|jgi:hypothetical protein|nr:hypothetical protein [Bacillota bacterium]
MLSNVSSSKPSQLIDPNRKIRQSEIKHSKDVIDNGDDSDNGQENVNTTDNGEKVASSPDPSTVTDASNNATNLVKNGVPIKKIDVKA